MRLAQAVLALTAMIPKKVRMPVYPPGVHAADASTGEVLSKPAGPGQQFVREPGETEWHVVQVPPVRHETIWI